MIHDRVALVKPSRNFTNRETKWVINAMEQELYRRIGRRIKSAREQLGLSQADLATQLDYNSAATVSHFESGMRKISIEDLFKIANVLQLPVGYFYDQENTPPKQEVRFRATEVRPSVRSEVNAFLAFAQEHSQKAVQFSALKEVTSPGAAAEMMLRRLTISDPPVVPETIAKMLNIPVFEWAFPDEISGLFVVDRGTVCIGVNQSHPKVRQRFTVAHELGHFAFSDGQDLFVDFIDNGTEIRDKKDQLAEKRANFFAASLLMPRQWLRRDFSELGIDGLSMLSRKYQVSEQALWFRLLNLKLIEE